MAARMENASKNCGPDEREGKKDQRRADADPEPGGGRGPLAAESIPRSSGVAEGATQRER